MRELFMGIMAVSLFGIGFVLSDIREIMRDSARSIVVTNTVTPVEIRTERVIEKPACSPQPYFSPSPMPTYPPMFPTNWLQGLSNGILYVTTPCIETRRFA